MGKEQNMKRLMRPLLATALGLLLFTGAQAHAAILWTADWTPGTTTVISDSGNNQILFSNQPAITVGGNSDVVATNISVNDHVVGASDTFTHQNYSLALKLTDQASGQFTTLTFSGNLTGTITPNSSNIANVFTGTLTQTVDLGTNVYTVTIGPYTPPGPAGSNPGSIGAHVDVQPNSGHEPNNTPEPSTMLLSCLGLAGLGWRTWRKQATVRA
jgi:PEP-CTERM motif-containing protein